MYGVENKAGPYNVGIIQSLIKFTIKSPGYGRMVTWYILYQQFSISPSRLKDPRGHMTPKRSLVNVSIKILTVMRFIIHVFLSIPFGTTITTQQNLHENTSEVVISHT